MYVFYLYVHVSCVLLSYCAIVRTCDGTNCGDVCMRRLAMITTSSIGKPLSVMCATNTEQHKKLSFFVVSDGWKRRQRRQLYVCLLNQQSKSIFYCARMHVYYCVRSVCKCMRHISESDCHLGFGTRSKLQRRKNSV